MVISRKALRASLTDAIPAKLGDKGRVYIPAEIVAVLKVKKGDYVIFRVVDGKITVEKLK